MTGNEPAKLQPPGCLLPARDWFVSYGRALAPAFLVFCIGFLLYRARPQMGLGIYMERDLERASALLHGVFPLFGPETWGGGRLIGPFFYYLLALPFSLGLGVGGVVDFLSLLQAAGLIGLAQLLRRESGELAAALFLAVVVPDWLFQDLTLFWNPSFLFPFLALLFWALRLFDRTGRFPWLLLAAASSGLLIQLHGSAWLLLIALTASLAERRNVGAWQWASLAAAFLLPLSFLIPALLSGAEGSHDLPTKAAEYLWSLPKSGRLSAFHPLKLQLPLYAVLWWLLFAWRAARGRSGAARLSWWGALCTLPYAAYALATNYGPRYGLLHWLCLLLFLAPLVSERLSALRVRRGLILWLLLRTAWIAYFHEMFRAWLYVPYLTASFALLLLGASLRSPWGNLSGLGWLVLALLFNPIYAPNARISQDFGSAEHADAAPVRFQRAIAREILKRSCWSALEARSRIYVHPSLGFPYQSGLGFLLREEARQGCRESGRWQGLMLVPKELKPETLGSDPAFSEQLRRLLREELLEYELLPAGRQRFGMLFLRFRDPELQMGNFGLGIPELERLLEDMLRELPAWLGAEGGRAGQLADGSLRFAWRSCREKTLYCVNELRLVGGERGFTAHFQSARWSAAMPSMLPLHAGVLSSPALSFDCPEGERRVQLLDRIGVFDAPGSYPDLRAPHSRRFPFPCDPSRVKEIRFSALEEHSYFSNRREYQTQKVPALSIRLSDGQKRNFLSGRAESGLR